MLTIKEAAIIAQEEMRKGNMNADQANVYIVQLMGVRIIDSRIPADTRKALNVAVKNGELGHIKKTGLKKEAYFHKNGRTNALEIIEKDFRNTLENLKKVYC